MQKKILILGMFLLITSLVACSNSKDSIEEKKVDLSKASSSPEASIGEQKNDKPIELEIFIDENAVWDENAKLNKEIEEKFGVNLKPIIRPSMDQAKWYSLKISSGEMFDYITSGGLHFNHYDKYIDQGIAIELDKSMINKKMPNLIKYLSRYSNVLGDNVFQWYERNNKIYSIPQVRPDDATRNVLAFRKDWLDKLGLKVPKTLNELEGVLKAFTEDDPDGNGKNDTYGYTGVSWLDYSLSFITAAYGVYPGQWYINNDAKLEFGNISPRYKEALRWIQKWYKAGYIDPELLTVSDWAIYKGKMCSSKAGVAAANYHCFVFPDDGWMYSDLLKINPKAEYTITNGITGPYGDTGMLQFNPITYAGIMFTPQVEDQPEKIAKYMEVFDALGFDEQWRLKQAWGYENETYAKDNKGGNSFIAPYDEIGTNENLKGELAKKYGIGPVGGISSGFKFTWEFWSDPTVNAKINYDAEKAKLDLKGITTAKGKYNIMNIAPIKLKSKDTYGEVLNALYNEYIVKIITGERSIDDFDEFVERWKQKGGDELLAEAEQVYEKYIK